MLNLASNHQALPSLATLPSPHGTAAMRKKRTAGVANETEGAPDDDVFAGLPLGPLLRSSGQTSIG